MVKGLSIPSSWLQWLPWSTHSIEKQRIFSTHSRHDHHQYYQIDQIRIKAANHRISSQLPGCTFKAAILEKTKDNKLSFSFQADDDVYIFRDEKSFDSWLAEKKAADILEIVDLRDTPKIVYKLHRLNARGYDTRTREELFSQLTEEYGVLWKLTSLDDRDTKYFRAKVAFWIKPFYQEVNFENLCYVADELQSMQQPSDFKKEKSCRASKPWWQNLKVVFLGGLAASAYWKMQDTLTGEAISQVAFYGALTYGFHLQNGCSPYAKTYALSMTALSLFNSADSANAPPVVTNSSAGMSLYPKQSISQTFRVRDFFSDPDRNTLAISFSSVPGFMQPVVQKLSATEAEFVNIGMTPISVQKVGDLLHVFGNNAYQIWNTTSPSLELLGTYSASISQGITNGDFTYLIANQGQSIVILQAANPLSPAPVFTINGSWLEIGLDNTRKVLWAISYDSSNNYLNSYSVSSPSAPVLLRSIAISSRNTNPIGMFVSQDGFIFCANYDLFGQRFNIYNGVDPANPSLEGNILGSNAPYVENQIAYGINSYYLRLHNISNPLSPFQISSEYTSTAPRFVTVNGPYAFMTSYLFPNNFYLLWMVDVSNPADPSTYLTPSPSFYATQVSVDENHLYFCRGSSIIGRIALNDINLNANPTWEDTGEYNLTITASDGHGGSANLNFPITVLNRDPEALNPIPNQTAYVDQPYHFNISAEQFFSDPDGGPLEFTFPNLASWLFFDSNSGDLSGTPSAEDVGDTEVQLRVSDPYGRSVDDRFFIHVEEVDQPSSTTEEMENPLPSEGSAERSTTGTTVGAVIGTLAGLGIFGGSAAYLWHRRKKASQANQSNAHFELSPIMKSNISEVFGERKYGWLNFIAEEKKEIFTKTGMIVQDSKGEIGNGRYGAIRICWSFEKNQYVVAKVITGQFNFKESEKEAQLQRDAAGPNVCPIYNTMRDETVDKLIHFMPLAGLNNLNNVRALMKQKKINDIASYAVFIAHDMLTGLQTIHHKKTYHCDLKPSNVITNLQGNSLLTDFGRSEKSNSPRIAKRDSDCRYQSPERAVQSDFFRADLDDAWAAGISLLEFMLGDEKPLAEIFPFLSTVASFRAASTSLENYKSTFQRHFDQIDELQSPNQDSIWWVIKNLLQLEPNKRWLPNQALKAKCLSRLSEAKRQYLFQKLSVEFIEEPEHLEEHMQTPKPTLSTQEVTTFYDHEEEDAFYG